MRHGPGYNGRGFLAARLARLIHMAMTRRSLPYLLDLAEELGVHHRTLRRDLEALREAGVPVPPMRRYYPCDVESPGHGAEAQG